MRGETRRERGTDPGGMAPSAAAFIQRQGSPAIEEQHTMRDLYSHCRQDAIESGEIYAQRMNRKLERTVRPNQPFIKMPAAGIPWLLLTNRELCGHPPADGSQAGTGRNSW